MGAWTLAYYVLKQIRSVLLVFTILFMQEYVVIQCLLVSVSSIILMAFVGYNRPSIYKGFNRGKIFDEYLVLLVMDCLLISSDPTLDTEMRIEIGYVLMGLLGVAILAGQGPILI